MPNMAKILKDEISRLSRKEVKKKAAPLAKKLVGLTRVIGRQKLAVAEMEKKIARLEKLQAESQPLPVAAPEAEVRKARISPRLIKTQRKRLKINQANFARLLNVSVAAVRSWEQGRSSPRGRNLAAFVTVRKLKIKRVRELLDIQPKRKKRARRKSRVRRKK